MKELRIGDTALSILEMWSIMTTISAVSGIAFLLGCFDQFGANFIFLFGLEDILVATILSMFCILTFGLVLYLFVLGSREAFNAISVHSRRRSELSWPIVIPAFIVVSALAFWLSARLASLSSGNINLPTTISVAIPLGLGLLIGFSALRGYTGRGFARQSAAARLLLAILATFLLLGVTPNNLGFAYMIYLWEGEVQLTPGDSIKADAGAEVYGSLICNQEKQILWVGSRVTILRCGNDMVGRVNATSERFWLAHFMKAGH